MLLTNCKILLVISMASISICLPSQDHTNVPSVTFNLGQMGDNPPVKISQVWVGSKPIEIGTPVVPEKGWIATTEIAVQNTSSKYIVSGDAILIFLGTGKGSQDRPYLSSVSNLGRYPASAFRRKDGIQSEPPGTIMSRPEIRIAPGETMRFRFAVDGTAVEAAASSKGSIGRVRISLSSFYFADGSKWSHGTYFLPADPPQMWTVVTYDQFARFVPSVKP